MDRYSYVGPHCISAPELKRREALALKTVRAVLSEYEKVKGEKMETSRNSVYLDGRAHRQLRLISESHRSKYGKKVSNSQIIRRALSLLAEQHSRSGFSHFEKGEFADHRKVVE